MPKEKTWTEVGLEYAPAIKSALGIIGSNLDRQERIDTARENTSRIMESVSVTERLISEQSDEIDAELGDALSGVSLEVLKATASASVRAAASGTAGGTTQAVTNESLMDGIRARDKMISQAKQSKINLAREELQAKLQAKNQLRSVRDELETDTTQSVLRGLATSLGSI